MKKRNIFSILILNCLLVFFVFSNALAGKVSRSKQYSQTLPCVKEDASIIIQEGIQAEKDFLLSDMNRSKALLAILSNRNFNPSSYFTIEDAEKEKELLKAIEIKRKELAESRDGAKPSFLQEENALIAWHKEVQERILASFLKDHPSPLPNHSADLEGIRKWLKDDQALVEYEFHEQGLNIYVVTGENVFKVSLPVRKECVERSIERLIVGTEIRFVLGRGKALRYNLHGLLVEPILKLVADKMSLVIVPDGKLHALSFATIGDGNGQYLVENFSISYAPSAKILGLLKA